MRRLVIGVGNPGRGDDGAGLEVARRVRTAEAIESPTGSYEMIELWKGADEVLIVDAARSGSTPGTLLRLDAGEAAIPGGVLATSTHSIGVAETIEMARALGRMPGSLTVYGIEASDLEVGKTLSPAVEEAVTRLVAEIDHA